MANEKKKFLEDLEESDVEKEKSEKEETDEEESFSSEEESDDEFDPNDSDDDVKKKGFMAKKATQRGRLQQAGGGAKPSRCQRH